MDIGSKIKSLRIQHNLTQEELALRCELSKGFISMLENDLTSPSVSTLNDLLEVFGMSLNEFFTDTQEEEIIFKSDEYFTSETDGVCTKFLISNAQSKELEPLLLTLQPKTSSKILDPHEGDIFGYVLKGSIYLKLNDDENLVKSGDSFYYSKPVCTQQLLNKSKSNEAIVLWISTPPLF